MWINFLKCDHSPIRSHLDVLAFVSTQKEEAISRGKTAPPSKPFAEMEGVVKQQPLLCSLGSVKRGCEKAKPGTHHTMPNRPLDRRTEVVVADSSHFSRKGALMMGNFHEHWHSKGWKMGSFPCCKKEAVTLLLQQQQRESKVLFSP